MSTLASKTCVPCRGDVPALKGANLHNLSHQLPNWTVVDEHHITRTFTFPDFQKALAFVNRIGAVAEEENHHPDLCLHGWNHLRIELYTHTADGISENDLIMAAKFNELLPPAGES